MPCMNPYARHIFICTGRYCDPSGKATHLYTRLARLLGPLGAYEHPRRVKRGTSSCLGVCSGGPIVVVYPDGIWYHHVDEAVLERIVREHLEQNRPVTEHMFHRLQGEGNGRT
ncbi:MAG: ferredoxin [Roseiflexus sp.]|nr:MAG: ferredoxin [Roseiflexus sp.]